MSADTRSASLPPVSAGETLGLSFLFDRFFPAGLSTEDPLAGSSSLVSGDRAVGAEGTFGYILVLGFW